MLRKPLYQFWSLLLVSLMILLLSSGTHRQTGGLCKGEWTLLIGAMDFRGFTQVSRGQEVKKLGFG